MNQFYDISDHPTWRIWDIWPFVVIVIVGIARAFVSYWLLGLYETAALNKPENFAFPTDFDMVMVRLLCVPIFLISSVLVISGGILGVYYGIHQKKDALYERSVAVAMILIILTLVALPIVFLFSLMGNSSDKKHRGFHYH